MDTAKQHLALLLSFIILTIILFFGRSFLLRHQVSRTADKFSSGLFALACASNIGNVSGLVYKCIREIQLRERMAKIEQAGGTVPEHIYDEFMLNPYWLRVVFFIGLFYMVELWILKAAFLALYYPFFQHAPRHLRHFFSITVAIIIATFVILFTLYFAWCRPLSSNWTTDLVEYSQCAFLPSTTAQTIQSSFNMGTDVLLLLLPLSIFHTLKLHTTEKWALVFVFTVGGFSICASAIRFSIIIRALQNQYTLDIMKMLERWSVVEYGCALMAFCLPALRVFLLRTFGAGSRGRSNEVDDEIMVGHNQALMGRDVFETYVSEGINLDTVAKKGAEEGVTQVYTDWSSRGGDEESRTDSGKGRLEAQKRLRKSLTESRERLTN